MVAVPSVKVGVTVRPPATALSKVTVKGMDLPSVALPPTMVRVALSSLLIVPVAVEVAVTLWVVPEILKPTVNVSSASISSSSLVETLKLCVSPAVPLKLSAVVFSV